MDLGFTIVHQSDENFYARIRAAAPCDGVPDVAAAEAEEVAEAYVRYSCLIGIAQPCDEAAGRLYGRRDPGPPGSDFGCFEYEDAERLMEQWSGVGRRPSALIL